MSEANDEVEQWAARAIWILITIIIVIIAVFIPSEHILTSLRRTL